MQCLKNWTGYNKSSSIHYNIPCRHCISCTVNKITDLRVRSLSEQAYYNLRGRGSSFIRLSYDDVSLPVVYNSQLYRLGELMNDGKIPVNHLPTVLISDLQKFWKRVNQDCKRIYGRDYMYMYALEYGDTSGRPHAHLILYGINNNEAQKIIGNQWDFGFIDYKPLLAGATSYIAKYMFHDVFGEEREAKYTSRGIEPPQLHHAKGLGERYFKQLIDNGAESFSYMGKKYPFPKYYRQKYGLKLPPVKQDMEETNKKAMSYVLSERQRGVAVDDRSLYNLIHKVSAKAIKDLVNQTKYGD